MMRRLATRRTTLLSGIAALFTANLVVTACSSKPADEPSPDQHFPTSPVVLQRPVVYGFFTDTSDTANAVMDDLSSLGAHVVVLPVADEPGIAAARRASSNGVGGYLALVVPATTTADDSGVATTADCDAAATIAQFDTLIDAAPDLQRFYLPADLGVRFNGCAPGIVTSIAQHIREAGPSAASIAIAPSIADNTACDDVCVDELTTSWTGFLQTSGIDVVMLNDGVLGKDIDPAVARSYFAPIAHACANANASFLISAESNLGTVRASAPDFYARLDFYVDAGLDAQVVTRTAEVDAAWACATDAGCTDDLRLCQATRLSGFACP